MWPLSRRVVKKEPESMERAQAALARAEQAEQESTEALHNAKALANEAVPVMRDLRAQRDANHFAYDIYRAMLNGGK